MHSIWESSLAWVPLTEIEERPSKTPLWQVIIDKYHPSLILSCENAILWSKEIVKEWLMDNMHPNNENVCEKIVNKLSDHKEMRTHSRHISLKEAKKIDLKVEPLEKDQKIQDIVLTIHHTYMHTLSSTPIIKITENHMNIGQTLIMNLPSKPQKTNPK